MSGGAGRALRGGGARRKSTSPAAQAKDGGYGPPPHPSRLIAGQVYWPRQARARRAELTIVRVSGDGRATAKRADGGPAPLSLSVARLLSRRDDGQGRFYAFLRWSPRRYRTPALITAVGGDRAMLVLPEWHPARTVSIAQRLLPVGAGATGDWLTVSADLSQPTGARLQVAPIAAADPPTDLGEVRRRPSPAGPDVVRRPSVGAGCGDIVLEQVESVDVRCFFLRERPAGLRQGAHVYCGQDGRVIGYRALESWRISPNGVSLECGSHLERLGQPIPVNGPRELNRWRWRWWPTTGAVDEPRSIDGHVGAEIDAATGTGGPSGLLVPPGHSAGFGLRPIA